MLFAVALQASFDLRIGSADEPRAEQTGDPVTGPLTVDESLKHFQLPEGLTIQAVAAEPAVIDPVEIRFDGRGRMWVVEMRDYPHGPQKGKKPRSRIRVLEDRDADGVFETAQTFAEEVLFPTGLQPWRGGVFVTLAGRIDYMKDTDGDGRADRTETWFRGFAEQNSQLRANHPRLGPDGWIYVANGLRGGSVVDARTPKAKPVSLRGMDFRFDPASGEFETLSGMGQFGLTFDDFGHRFVCSNRNPLKHIVIEDRYLKLNPRAVVEATAHDVAAAGAESKLFPLSRAWTTSNLHAGQFTAACGVKIYRGDALPRAYYGNAFTCDPTGNLVHREVLHPAGATFHSQPAREGVEFLASPDEWFRPVNLELGPDGALYVVDMYRAVIEHPQFMPAELKRRPDLLHGTDHGRIYRIVPRGFSNRSPAVHLPDAEPEELVRRLEHPSAWWRTTAARLLVEGGNRNLFPAIERVAREAELPAARVQALRLLARLKETRQPILSAALGDEHPGVRAVAIRLSEPRLEDEGAIRGACLALAGDESPHVRFQLALSLAAMDGNEVTAALEDIALAVDSDPWTRRAVSIAARSRADRLAVRLLSRLQSSAEPLTSQQQRLLQDLLGQVGRTGNEGTVQEVLAAILALPAKRGVLDFKLHALESLAATLGASRLRSLAAKKGQEGLESKLKEFIDRAEQLAGDDRQPLATRLAALGLLRYARPESSIIAQLALRGSPQSLRQAALRALPGQGDAGTWRSLFEQFPRLTPRLRSTVIDAALARTESTELLLDRLEAGVIQPGELDQGAIRRLTQHRNNALRDRAKKILAAAVPADRKKVLAEYQVALKLNGDPQRGLTVFKKNCAQCHRIGETGVNVAPDISDSRTKQPAQLLTDILQPNRAIDAAFINYTVATDAGQVLSGVIASETATSLTLKQPEGKTVTLLRTEIDEIRSTGTSLMPEGVEKKIPPQAMADLIAFIKNWRYLDGRVPVGGSK